MKTTIDIPDPLMEEARRIAREQGITLKALMESALRQVVEAEQREQKPFRLRHCSFGGEGMAPELADASWDEIRSLIYEGRGG